LYLINNWTDVRMGIQHNILPEGYIMPNDTIAADENDWSFG
jgi:hypothetical protein